MFEYVILVILGVCMGYLCFIDNRFRRLYINWWRRRIPDWLYTHWLRIGIMDSEDYREWQQQGFISHDIDPENLR